MTNIDFESNNTRQTAEDISYLERELLTDGLVITNDDWFRIEVNSGTNSFLSAALYFDHSQGDLDFQLLDSNGISLDSGTSTTDDEYVQANGLSNGIYYLRVYGYTYPIAGDGVEYSLQWDDFPRNNRTFDFESNTTLQTAEDISFREGELLDGGIISLNEDWFEIYVDSESDSLTASIYFDDDKGDLDFQLLDSAGSVIGSSTSTSDNESIEASDLSEGTYYLRVYSYRDRILGNDYDLEWEDSSSSVENTTGVHRFFNSSIGVHFYTASETEKDYVQDHLSNYSYEGVSFEAVPNNGDSVTGTSPVYRFYNQSTGVHLYTVSEVEKEYIEDNLSNWQYENIAYRGYTEAGTDRTALYRFYNSTIDAHFYTPSAAERDYVLDNLPNYELEGNGGVAFYVAEI